MRNNKETIIPINEEYRLTADKYQWIIQQARSRKGKMDWRSKWFYPTLQSALKGLGELMVRRSGAQTLAEALETVEKVTTTLSPALTPQLEGKVGPQDERPE